jgi:GNAT superfamily N-acetyltransferase
MGFTVRNARLEDVQGIREVFHSEYDLDYAYPQYYDIEVLARLVYANDSILLVAIDESSGRVAGTASVVFSIGAHDDLSGEFGRLVVHPDFRGCGIGKSLMEARVDRIKERLHVGIVDNRAVHSFSQRISERFHFVPVGFIPMKLLVKRRESVAVFVQHFGQALELRRNNPHVIPEAALLANIALDHCRLPQDVVIDDRSDPYPPTEADFEIERLKTQGYSSLLRIERGRLRHREIFGPVRLHYGLFQLQARHSDYLMVRRGGHVVGGIGYMVDENEKAVRIFEVISMDEQPIRLMLESLLCHCERELGIEYIDVDVSAHAPRMQRTLLELGFLPVSYMPANAFDAVERIDAIRMARLFVPFDLGDIDLLPSVRRIADVVIAGFHRREILPEIASAAGRNPLLEGLSAEQQAALQSICQAAHYPAGAKITTAGEYDPNMHLILNGSVEVRDKQGTVARLQAGQCLGESSLLAPPDETFVRTVDAVALQNTTTARFASDDFHRLLRRRPDIGVVVFRNLALDVSHKLRSLR